MADTHNGPGPSLDATQLMLVMNGVSVEFGGVAALRQVDCRVPVDTIVGMVGPNGAGKSTLMNVISGLVRPSSGSVELMVGEKYVDLTRRPRYDRARLGVGRTFQHSRLFVGLTVIDQLMCGAYHRTGYGMFAAMTRLPKAKHAENAIVDEAEMVLEELGLAHARHAAVSSLPAAHRRFVDLGRALMAHPRLLLLDEIAAGMTETEKERVINLICRRNKDSHLTAIVIEHDLDFVRSLAPTTIVLAQGRTLAVGPTAEVLARQDVFEAYIGG
jgi:branched-chain amino acid transport system ATP-binding protein